METTTQRAFERTDAATDVLTTLVDCGLLTVGDAAKFLAVGRSTLYAAMDSGKLPYCKIGRSRRIPRRALVEFAAGTLTGGWAIQSHSECDWHAQPLTQQGAKTAYSRNVVTGDRL
jgi:excisionase family DNA binding protein